jgi:hypothetical protein
MINNLHKVTDNLYRGAAPSPKDVKWLKDHLGIKKIVSLDKTAGDRISRACKLLQIKQVMLPLDITRKSLLTLAHQNLHYLLDEGGPVFIHCHYGKDRTGLVVAMYKCRYMNGKPDDVIKEAKSYGFGVNVDPKVVHLYEKIIKSCKPVKDENNADIVSNTRETKTDNRSGILDEANPSSFAPGLDSARRDPVDFVYNPINDQSPTRQNYKKNEPISKHDNSSIIDIPQVGQYNNDAGIHGAGPAEPVGGFIND